MRRRKLVGVVLAGLLLAGCTSTPAAVTFSNPIEAVGQDPYVVQWNHRYLLIEERHDDELWIVESRRDDLTGIGEHGSAHRIWTAPDHGSICTDLWAPELHLLDGHWYVYVSGTTCDGENANHRMAVLESATGDPLGTYSDRGRIEDATDRWAIDGTVFAWRGRRYFVWSGWAGPEAGPQNLYIAAMTSPTALSGPRRLLSRPTLAWEQHGAAIEEGPEALQHAGELFLVYSASGSWTDDYCDGLLRFRGGDPLDAGSWTKSQHPVFSSANGTDSPGHGSFVRSPDGSEWWTVYGAEIAQGSGWSREVDAQRFTWRSDGTPDFGRPVGDTGARLVPSGSPG